MRKAEEAELIYRRVLENFTLYNQYQNEVDFDKAVAVSESIMRINNLAVKQGKYKGDISSVLEQIENRLKSENNNKPIYFI